MLAFLAQSKMPAVRRWWRTRSRRTRARLIFYPGVVLLAAGFLAFTMVMPGRSHHGPLEPLSARETELAGRLRSDVTALGGDAAIAASAPRAHWSAPARPSRGRFGMMV
jgi:hypothetical protein